MTNNSIRVLAFALTMTVIATVVVTLERQSIEEPWPMLFQQAAVDPEITVLQYRARANLDRLMQVASVEDLVEEL